MTAVTESARGDQGRLVLRLAVAGLMLPHGLAKISGGVDWISGMLSQMGLPGFLAYGAYAGEIVAPVLVLAGVLTRPAAMVIALQMVAAILLAKRDAVFTINPQSGGHLRRAPQTGSPPDGPAPRSVRRDLS